MSHVKRDEEDENMVIAFYEQSLDSMYFLCDQKYLFNL